MIKHFLSLSSFSVPGIQSLLDRAVFFSLKQQTPEFFQSHLQNKIIANVFYEPSTRTRFSFEIAAKRLGAQVISFVPENSSVKKGETVYDTLKSLESLGVDGIVFRHSDDHVFDELHKYFHLPLINAGAGKYEHPSQGLLDLMTLYQEFGRLKGLKVAICGDIKHSRVAGSLIIAAEKFGIELFFCGPESFHPLKGEIASFDEIIPHVDAIMMLRIQKERHESLEMDEKVYHSQYGLTLKRVQKMKDIAIILHPGPFNRGIEIASEVVEHPQSRIFKQMSNGVYSRMAILEWALLNGDKQ